MGGIPDEMRWGQVKWTSYIIHNVRYSIRIRIRIRIRIHMHFRSVSYVFLAVQI